MQTLYADGIANIRFVDGVVRLDLVQVAEIKSDQMQVQPTATLAMSLPAMVRMHQQLDAALVRLAEQGVLKRREASEPIPAATVSTTAQ